MHWIPHAQDLAETVTHPDSRWRAPVATTPRHVFVPRWWAGVNGGWELRDGHEDETAWATAAYSDRTLVTKVGELHADHAVPDAAPAGRPTSSSTLPSLVVQMLRHLRVHDDSEVLDVATGSGYSAALLSRLLGEERVTSIDVDPYLTGAAAGRLDEIGLHPKVLTVDATGPVPGEYDRIVSMVAVRPIPASWLAALRPGGRLVTVVANTSMIVTAWKTEDGSAVGQVERDWAMFMSTRTGADYPPGLGELLEQVRDREGEEVSRGRYGVIDVQESWEVNSMLEVLCPGIEHHFERRDDGRRTAWMLHADGSWARATALRGDPPTVHQGGPRRLWDVLEQIRHRQSMAGGLPVYGAKATISPDGVIRLKRGAWEATIG
ncbi:protein-L-isoaspartate O-methyltransferase [Planomonospora parontospora subsp. parontospora]|uniref:Protein-L-isoaspartate O-methyltransferase n=2 Tax=Planomonospora parontospora TaxID=58119 RepID=A0AA37BLY8_9ACTN|nr:methyltransferase domain-containing protein [Planomonospora parontospora]GGK91120.1 protein-L-isoaspartate O-methyltransferase [Planomonospora parontospora]GII12051.1 protein-L-isoaspartate O-methyltransferase [Planomonospora parontospora subsp. parontospora]